ncbi:hypothetical protein [Humibacter ginsenosidimutans]|uniref:hypothetical protein n=1 Tax=Humibacter ginsenosidimutans TaxID=2599293 RepID=UPI001AEF886B|nr:hypothetical protein [Humibacter ginsenosidimutans]
MPVARYRPDQFVASGWDSGTPDRKARFVNALLRFIADGDPREHFTRTLYMGLSNHGYFGFIAHYDIHGFYGEKFSTPARQAEFLRDLTRSCRHDARLDRPDLWTDVKQILLRHLHDGTLDDKRPVRRRQPFVTATPAGIGARRRGDAPTLFQTRGRRDGLHRGLGTGSSATDSVRTRWRAIASRMRARASMIRLIGPITTNFPASHNAHRITKFSQPGRQPATTGCRGT